MTDLLSFLIVILAGVVFSALFNRLHLPWVVALIVAGIAIGPHGLGFFEASTTIKFLSDIGLIFLMFMAGLETRLSGLRELGRDIGKLALINGLVPFVAGLGIGLALGLSPLPALLLGTIFISSSIAVVVPALEANRLMHVRLGKTIVGAAMITDIFSLVLLSFVLQTTQETANLPLFILYPLFFAFIIALRWMIPLLKTVIRPRSGQEHDLFERELRYVFIVLIGTVVLFEVLGLHSIIAGFFAGLVLSEFITSEILREKLHAISYGLFIPVFFVVIGSETNFTAFGSATTAVTLILAVVLGSIIAKFATGWLGGRWIGFSRSQSVLVGVATMPQLSTTLAVAASALTLNLFDEKMLAAIVALSIVTTFIAPILIRRLAHRADAALTPPIPSP